MHSLMSDVQHICNFSLGFAFKVQFEDSLSKVLFICCIQLFELLCCHNDWVLDVGCDPTAINKDWWVCRIESDEMDEHLGSPATTAFKNKREMHREIIGFLLGVSHDHHGLSLGYRWEMVP